MGCSRETLANLHAWFLTGCVTMASYLIHSFVRAVAIYWVPIINKLSKT